MFMFTGLARFPRSRHSFLRKSLYVHTRSRAGLAIEIFTKKNVARKDLGNRATVVSPGSCEEVPR